MLAIFYMTYFIDPSPYSLYKEMHSGGYTRCII